MFEREAFLQKREFLVITLEQKMKKRREFLSLSKRERERRREGGREREEKKDVLPSKKRKTFFGEGERRDGVKIVTGSDLKSERGRKNTEEGPVTSFLLSLSLFLLSLSVTIFSES